MKFLRFLALLIAVSAVALAQNFLAHPNLVDLIPDRLLDTIPSLRSLAGWSPANLQMLAFFLAAAGGLLYGLVAQPWPATHAGRRTVTGSRATPWGWLPIVLAAGAGAGLAFILWRGDAETPAMLWVWAGSLLIFVSGCWLLGGGGDRGADSPVPPARPEAGWPFLIAILAVAALLFTWQLARVPLRVDGDVASHGLQALAIASGAEPRVFAPGWANLPLLAYYPAALGMLFSGDWVVGNRLAGVYAGLLVLLGVWLLGCELFRRPPRPSVPGPVAADDGGQTALLAAALTAIGYTFVHFSRLPQYLEPVAWGTLALWALQRGVRTGSRLALGASGLLLGAATTFYFSGRVFLVVAVLWWLGLLLFRPDWMRPRRAGVAGAGVWLAGLFVFTAPFLGIWLRVPAFFLQRIREVAIWGEAAQVHMAGVYAVGGLPGLIWESFKRAALTFVLYADTSTHFGYDGPMLDVLAASLLVLGVGVVLLNLDRLLSWQLLFWLLSVIVLGGALTINAPFWPRLLPALPVAGLLAALAVDRGRATLGAIGGGWLQHLGAVLIAGLLVLAGAHNWVGYYERYSVQADPASAVGRALHRLPVQQPRFLVVGEGRPGWDDRTVAYLAGLPYREQARGELRPGALPARLPPGSAILLFPGDRSLAADLEARYPGGRYQTQRDRLGNPMLVIYELP